jgi:hypothetical protein
MFSCHTTRQLGKKCRACQHNRHPLKYGFHLLAKQLLQAFCSPQRIGLERVLFPREYGKVKKAGDLEATADSTAIPTLS